MEDTHGIAQKGANSPKHAFPQAPYQHKNFPQMVYGTKSIKTVNSPEELTSALAAGFRCTPEPTEELAAGFRCTPEPTEELAEGFKVAPEPTEAV